jgi:hypothetical protein
MRAPRPIVVGVIAAAAAIAAAGAGARAAPDEGVPAPHRPAWSVSLLGGALQPIGTMKSSHQRGLAAGIRVAWSSRIGLGLEAAFDYSPLPHAAAVDATFDTTYGTAAAGPSYTVGWPTVRFGIAAMGGMAIDRTRTTDTLLGATTDTRTAPAITGAVEIKLLLVSGGGLILAGGGTRTFGTLDYRYATATAGLTLAF